MAAHIRVDWEQLEAPWRAGIKSVLQIAADYEVATGDKVSHTAINKHFKKLGVPRDLAAKIQAKADAMVSAAMVSGKVSTETTETDAKIINDGAAVVASVRLSQRSDIQRSRKLCMALLSELEETTGNIELFKQLGELMSEPDEKGQDKRAELYQKVLSLSGRTSNMKSLADSLKTLVTLEREAFGIKVADDPEDLGKRITKIERVIVG